MSSSQQSSTSQENGPTSQPQPPSLAKVYVAIINKAVLVASQNYHENAITPLNPFQVADAACEELGLDQGILQPLLMHGMSGTVMDKSDILVSGAVYYLLFIPRDMSLQDALPEIPKVAEFTQKLAIRGPNDLKMCRPCHFFNTSGTPGMTPGIQSGEVTQHFVMARHLKRRTFFCPMLFCRKQMMHSGDLKIHFRTHTGQRPFECPFCKQDFSKKILLTQHLHQEVSDKLAPCSICGTIFHTRCSQVKHSCTKANSSSKQTSCPLCIQPFRNTSALQVHILSHVVQDKLKCELCGLTFKIEENFHNHTKLKHSEATSTAVRQNSPPPPPPLHRPTPIKYIPQTLPTYIGQISSIQEMLQRSLTNLAMLHQNLISQQQQDPFLPPLNIYNTPQQIPLMQASDLHLLRNSSMPGMPFSSPLPRPGILQQCEQKGLVSSTSIKTQEEGEMAQNSQVREVKSEGDQE